MLYFYQLLTDAEVQCQAELTQFRTQEGQMRYSLPRLFHMWKQPLPGGRCALIDCGSRGWYLPRLRRHFERQRADNDAGVTGSH